MTTRQPAKKRKAPYSMLQSMVVKHCAMTKVNSMFCAVLMPAPAARVSRGWISVGYSLYYHPNIVISTASVTSAGFRLHDIGMCCHQLDRVVDFSCQTLCSIRYCALSAVSYGLADNLACAYDQ